MLFFWLSFRPKTKVSKIDVLKEIVRAYAMKPEQVLTQKALNQPAITQVNPDERQNVICRL
jgi:hypothetical protein